MPAGGDEEEEEVVRAGEESWEPDRREEKGAELLTKLPNGSTKLVTRRMGQIVRAGRGRRMRS